MILVGIDPSFQCTGISILDVEKKAFLISAVVANKVEVKSFVNIAKEAIAQAERVVSCIKEIETNEVYVISETPPPVGIFSAGLFSLDSALFLKITEYKKVKALYALPCTYLRSVHGFKYKKSDSTKLAMSILEKFKDIGYKWTTKSKKGIVKDFGKMNNDMAESFLFLCRLLILKGYESSAVDTARFIQKESIFL